MIGTIVNTACIITGTLVGTLFRKGLGEKYRKTLSDSGREAGERGSQVAEKGTKPVFQLTPQADFRKQKISPNQAQGEAEAGKTNGLKDLSKLIGEKAKETAAVEAEKAKKPEMMVLKNENTGMVRVVPVGTPLEKGEVNYSERKQTEEETHQVDRPVFNSPNIQSAVVEVEEEEQKDNSVEDLRNHRHAVTSQNMAAPKSKPNLNNNKKKRNRNHRH